MMIRWYQVESSPSLPSSGPMHAHTDTKREPFLLNQQYKGMVKDLIRLRYTLLPMGLVYGFRGDDRLWYAYRKVRTHVPLQ